MPEKQLNALINQLLPTYLARRRQDVVALRQALETKDFGTVEWIGHQLAGNASTYGFEELARLGRALESAAKDKDPVKTEKTLQRIAGFLDTLGPRRVLVIEDDPCILDVLDDLLTEEGYEVMRASHGREAIDLLRSGGEPPGLILLDLMMPVMDGVEFRRAQAADGRLAGIPVVLMSADRDVEARREEVGAGLCMRKPLDLEKVLETVGRHFDPAGSKE